MQLKDKSISGFLWVFLDQVGGQLIGFLVSIVLARILVPSDFGLIAMTTLFVNIGNTLMDSGLTMSLIRSKENKQIDYATVFYINISVGILIYFLLYFAAPLVASFYSSPLLEDILKVYTLTFIINSFFAVQKAILVKDMNFKYQLRISLPSLILSGIFGVYLAYLGHGVWSLVYMYIVKSIIDGILYWQLIKWRPTREFSWKLAKYHLKYGINICISSLIHVIYTDLYNLFIGRIYNPAILGYYFRANSTKTLIVNNLSTTLDKVLFPVFAQIQDDDARLKIVYRRVMQQVFFWICPILTYFLIMASPIFTFVFSDKWLPAVPYFQILCLVGILTPIQTYNVNILKVKGRSDLVLKLEYIKKPIFIIGIIISIKYGIMALMWNQVIANLVGLFINSYYSGRMIDYSLLEQVKDLFKTIMSTLVIGAFGYYLLLSLQAILSPLVLIMLVALLCLPLYLGLSYLIKNPPFGEFSVIFKKFIKSRQ
ncbi:lipopolysaccharide biosynthesis protein [Sphingobacterium thalpophilum]|uniref:Lipopolysaccharide biosynthesis protein n=1 Tax=Sphingobacterium thalpophilum TaxID=259 RepID=A0ABV4H8M6_9SPHI